MLDDSAETIPSYRNSERDEGNVICNMIRSPHRTEHVQSDSPYQYDYSEHPLTYPPAVFLMQDILPISIRKDFIESPLSPTVRDFTASHIQLDSPHAVAHGGFSDIYIGTWNQGSEVKKVSIVYTQSSINVLNMHVLGCYQTLTCFDCQYI